MELTQEQKDKNVQLSKQIGLVAQMCVLATLNGEHDFNFEFSPHVQWVQIYFKRGKQFGSHELFFTWYTKENWINEALKFIEDRATLPTYVDYRD